MLQKVKDTFIKKVFEGDDLVLDSPSTLYLGAKGDIVLQALKQTIQELTRGDPQILEEIMPYVYEILDMCNVSLMQTAKVISELLQLFLLHKGSNIKTLITQLMDLGRVTPDRIFSIQQQSGYSSQLDFTAAWQILYVIGPLLSEEKRKKISGTFYAFALLNPKDFIPEYQKSGFSLKLDIHVLLASVTLEQFLFLGKLAQEYKHAGVSIVLDITGIREPRNSSDNKTDFLYSTMKNATRIQKLLFYLFLYFYTKSAHTDSVHFRLFLSAKDLFSRIYSARKQKSSLPFFPGVPLRIDQDRYFNHDIRSTSSNIYTFDPHSPHVFDFLLEMYEFSQIAKYALPSGTQFNRVTPVRHYTDKHLENNVIVINL